MCRGECLSQGACRCGGRDAEAVAAAPVVPSGQAAAAMAEDEMMMITISGVSVKIEVQKIFVLE